MLKFLNGFLKSSKLESIAILTALLIGLFCGFSTLAFAKTNSDAEDVSARKILRIEIQGNKKIEKDAILLKIKSKAGAFNIIVPISGKNNPYDPETVYPPPVIGAPSLPDTT
jgi:hypothetical protein